MRGVCVREGVCLCWWREGASACAPAPCGLLAVGGWRCGGGLGVGGAAEGGGG